MKEFKINLKYHEEIEFCGSLRTAKKVVKGYYPTAKFYKVEKNLVDIYHKNGKNIVPCGTIEMVGA